jgi:serine/threonine protein kinase
MTRLDLISGRDLPVTVGRYTLTGLLGEGGMARVFRAQMEGALGFKKPAAVKVVLPAGGDRGASLRQQLIQEARLGGLLNHPNVVQTFDCGELEGFPYIAMELVEGAGLDNLVEEVGPLPPAVLLDITVQIGRGLHHAHTARHEGESLEIIHRDVKPSNVLVREDGVVKVMDFGIAKVAMADALSTATGMTKGTPSYMAPEQLAADSLDARTDLFALGALMHYMRTGKTLFVGSSLTEVMLRIIQVDDTVRDQGVLTDADEYLPGLGAVLGRLLVKDPAARYASAADLVEDLSALRKRLPDEPNTVGKLVTQHFGDVLADARQKASSIQGPSPFRSDGDLVAASAQGDPPPEPVGATRSFPGAAVVSGYDETRSVPGQSAEERALPPAQLLAGGGSGWLAGEPEVEGPGGGITQTRPQIAKQPPKQPPKARAAVPSPGQKKVVPPPQRRKRQRRDSPAKGRQGALFALGIAAGGLIAVLLVGLLLRGDGEPVPAVTDGDGSTEATAAPPADLPAVPESEPTPRPSQRTPTPRSVPPPVVRDPTPRRDPVRPRPDPTPAPEPLQRPRPEPTPAPEPLQRPRPDPTPDRGTKEPVEPRLAAEHVPITRAAVGTTKSVVVTVEGPSGTVVTLYYGPPGGPHTATRLDAQGGSVYKGSISVGEALGGGFEYWVVVKNRTTTPRVVALGRQSDPYMVSVF